MKYGQQSYSRRVPWTFRTCLRATFKQTVTTVDTVSWHLPVTTVDTVSWHLAVTTVDTILASAGKHLDALLCTNMRTFSGVYGSDSVFAEDSCLHWCGAVTLSECSPTFRPIFREYSTTQRRTQIRRESSSSCYKVTHFPCYCSPRIVTNTCVYAYVYVYSCMYVYTYIHTYIHIHIQLLTITLASQPVKCQSQKHHLTLEFTARSDKYNRILHCRIYCKK